MFYFSTSQFLGEKKGIHKSYRKEKRISHESLNVFPVLFLQNLAVNVYVDFVFWFNDISALEFQTKQHENTEAIYTHSRVLCKTN